jgi:hypothetical protein
MLEYAVSPINRQIRMCNSKLLFSCENQKADDPVPPASNRSVSSQLKDTLREREKLGGFNSTIEARWTPFKLSIMLNLVHW